MITNSMGSDRIGLVRGSVSKLFRKNWIESPGLREGPNHLPGMGKLVFPDWRCELLPLQAGLLRVLPLHRMLAMIHSGDLWT